MKKLLKFGIVSLSVATLSGFLPGQLNQGLTEQLTVYAEDGQADSTSTETEGSVTETKEESVTDSVSPEDKVVEEVEVEGAEEVAEEETVDDSSTSASDQVSGPIEIITANPEPLPHSAEEVRVIKLAHWLYGQPEFSEISMEPGQSIDLQDYVRKDESIESFVIYKQGNQYGVESKVLGAGETRVHYDDVPYFYQRDDYSISYTLKKEYEEILVTVWHTPDVPIYSEEEYDRNRSSYQLLDSEDVRVLQKDQSTIIKAKDIDGWEYLGWELFKSIGDEVIVRGESREFSLDESIKNFQEYGERTKYFNLYFLYKPVTEAAKKVALFEPKTVTVNYVLQDEDGSSELLATETQIINPSNRFISSHYEISDNHYRYTYEPVDLERYYWYHEIEDGKTYTIPVKLRDKRPNVIEDEAGYSGYLVMSFTNIPNMSEVSPYAIGEDSSYVILRLKKGEPKKQFIPPATFNGKGFTGYGRVGYSAFGASGVVPELTEDLFIDYEETYSRLGTPRYVFVYSSDIFPETPLPFRHRLTDDKGSNLEIEFTKADGAKTLEVIAHIEPTAATPAPIERLAGQDFDLYDIVVKDEQGNLLTDLNHKALAKLPVDEGKTVVKVIYLPDTGQAEELPILKQEDGFVYFEVEHFSHYGIVYEGQVTPPAPEENTPPKEEVKTKTITIVEERQDVDGRVVFTKTHTFVLKPDQVETLPLDQTVDQLIRGSNIAAYNAYEDGAVIHFTTRKRPSTQDQTPKDPSAEEMAAVIAEIEKLATELVSLGGTPRHYLPEVIEKVKAGDVQVYKAYDFVNIKAGLLEQIAEAKKVTETPTPKVLTDQDLTTFAEIARLYDEVIALGGKPWDQLHGIAEIAKSGDKERMTNVLYSYENIRGFVTRLENQLAELKKAQETPKPELKDLSSARNKLLLELDESSLTDQQKGQLAEKIAFAETEKDLTMIREAFAKLTKPADKKESGRTTAPVAAAQSGTEAVAKSAKAGLPATGDRGELGLLTAGLTLLLASLGLTKKRRN